MKILIIGSMAFVKDMQRVEKALRKIGHDAHIPQGSKPHIIDASFVDALKANLDFCIKNNVMKRNFDEVAKSDAVLVINHERNNIGGYIGISALMEMAIAYHFNKKIFVHNQIPDYKKIRWAHEVSIMQPVIIHGDLSKIV